MSTVAPPVDARIDRLERLLRDHRLDAIVLCSFEAVSYFGGIHLFTQVIVPARAAYLLVRPDEEPLLIVCDVEESLVRAQTPLRDVRVYTEFAQEPVSAVAGFLSGRVGIERRRLTTHDSETLREAGVELVPVDDAVEAAQMAKDPLEVNVLERAARATQASIEEALASARAGASEREVAASITAGLLLRGAFPVFLVFGAGERAMLAHAEPTDRPLRPGDIVRVDAGARFELALLGDLARTAIVGEPTTRQESVLAALVEAEHSTVSLVEPGRPVFELYRRCRRSLEAAALPFGMPHIGHGIGIGLHEAPHIHPGNETPLAPGMVINIEPFVVLPEAREAYHIEDLVLVTEDGYRLLSTPQDRLLKVEVP